MPNWAPQMRVAFSSMAWNTGSSSPGDELMTFSTSDVAVCCSSNSVRSSVRWRSSFSGRRVLDGDDGLTGIRLQCRKLLLRERSGRDAHDAERADGRLTAHQRDESRRPIAAPQKILSADRHFRRRVLDVGNIKHLAVENGDTVHVFARERERKALPP